jgi:undecaprenyl-diphosphatase
MTALLHWDRALFLLVNTGWANPVFDALFVAITDGRFWIVPGVVAAAVLLKVERKRALIALGLALLTVLISDPLCVRVLKPLFHRLRPCDPHALVEGGRYLLGMKHSLAFPSAHATNLFAQAVVWTHLYPRRGLWFFLFAASIALSRVYVGVHYPLDVVGGAAVGCGLGLCVVGAYRRVVSRIKGRELAHG